MMKNLKTLIESSKSSEEVVNSLLSEASMADIIKSKINQYSVSDDPYDVAEEIGKEHNWNDSQIEKAEKIIRRKYIK